MLSFTAGIEFFIAMGMLMYIIGMIVKGINKVMWVLGLVFLVYFVIYYGYIGHL